MGREGRREEGRKEEMEGEEKGNKGQKPRKLK